MSHTFIMALLAVTAVTPAFAQDHVFNPMPAPSERPYPYKILGMQPGDSLDEILAVFASRTEDEPTGENEIIGVQSPDGRSLEFTYERFRQVGGLTLNERIAEANFNESITAYLSSSIMDQRPVKIVRSMRLASDDLPTAQALQAQVEGTYGPPSKVETSNGSVVMTYAWSDEGFIADLEGQPTREHTFTERDGREITTSIRPCYDRPNGAYEGQVEYNFQYPRRLELMPGCIARFTVSHRTTPGTTTISFGLTDFGLARQHRAELDRQIIEELTGEREVEASDMDL